MFPSHYRFYRNGSTYRELQIDDALNKILHSGVEIVNLCIGKIPQSIVYRNATKFEIKFNELLYKRMTVYLFLLCNK